MSLEKELRNRGFSKMNGSVWMDWFRTIEFENGNRYYIVIYREQFKSYFRITFYNSIYMFKKNINSFRF